MSERHLHNGLDRKFPGSLIEERLSHLEAGQSEISGTLGLILDTLQLQTTLLRELTKYAHEDPTPSPIIKSLNQLIDAVLQMDKSVTLMADQFGELSVSIKTASESEETETDGFTDGLKGKLS